MTLAFAVFSLIAVPAYVALFNPNKDTMADSGDE